MCLVLSVVRNIEELVHTLFFWIEVGSIVCLVLIVVRNIEELVHTFVL